MSYKCMTFKCQGIWRWSAALSNSRSRRNRLSLPTVGPQIGLTTHTWLRPRRSLRGWRHNVPIIGGDVNSPDIDLPSLSIQGNQYPLRLSQTILDLLNDNDLEQTVDFPTSKDKTLDLIMTIYPYFKSRCNPHLPSLGNSDHDIVLCDTSLTPFRSKPPGRQLFLWKKADVRRH